MAVGCKLLTGHYISPEHFSVHSPTYEHAQGTNHNTAFRVSRLTLVASWSCTALALEKDINSGARLPGFRSQLCLLLAVDLWESQSIPARFSFLISYKECNNNNV